MTTGEHRPATAWLPGIEMLRGIAALSVVFHHSWSVGVMPKFTGSWIVEGFGTWGVSLFFVLSGFLLADHFWRGNRDGRLKRFYIRRMFRIVPAYYVNVTVLFLFFANHELLFSRTGLEQTISNLTFTHYLRPETSSSLNVNGALWTLTIEALLYLTMPLLAWATERTRGWAVLGFAGLGICYRLMVARQGAWLQARYFDPGFPTDVARLFLARQFLGVLPLFSVGIGLKWLLHRGVVRTWKPRWTVGPQTLWIVGLLLPSVLWLRWIHRAVFYQHWIWFTLWDLILALLFVPVLLMCASPMQVRGRFDAASVWLGERSYGLYLWHFPIVLSLYGRGPFERPADVHPWPAKLAGILVLSLAAAAASWAAVERPSQAVARRLTQRSG